VSAEARRLSSSLFNNDKLADVVGVLDVEGTATAQEIARAIGVTHDLVKAVLVRLGEAGLVKALPRIGGTRGALPYEVQRGDEWRALAALCDLVRSR
jgi:DNA-binding transcriptional ArsR family regulator